MLLVHGSEFVLVHLLLLTMAAGVKAAPVRALRASMNAAAAAMTQAPVAAPATAPASTFFNSIGRPRYIAAPMVQQSEKAFRLLVSGHSVSIYATQALIACWHVACSLSAPYHLTRCCSLSICTVSKARLRPGVHSDAARQAI